MVLGALLADDLAIDDDQRIPGRIENRQAGSDQDAIQRVHRYDRPTNHRQLGHVLRVNVLEDSRPVEVDELPYSVCLQLHHPGHLHMRKPGAGRSVSSRLDHKCRQLIAVCLVPSGEDVEGPLLNPNRCRT